jgi:hypothetical protein
MSAVGSGDEIVVLCSTAASSLAVDQAKIPPVSRDPIRKHFTRQAFADEDEQKKAKRSKRFNEKCNYCRTVIPYSNSKLETLERHLTKECTKIPPEQREDVIRAVAAKVPAAGSSQTTLTGKRMRQVDIRTHQPGSALTALTPAQAQQVNHLLCAWAVEKGVAFRAFDSSYLDQAMNILRAGFKVPSDYTFRAQLLPRYYAKCMASLLDVLKEAYNLTIAMDGWTDLLHRSALAILVILPDRRSYVLKVLDLSSESHTSELLAGALVFSSSNSMCCVICCWRTLAQGSLRSSCVRRQQLMNVG